MRLIENVSRNGNLLLNFGPKSDGTFADGETAIMLGIGEWLGVNGEAIYKTRPWTKFGEGDSVYGKPAYTGKDIRFTRNGDTLYAILMAWPGEQAVVASLASGLDVGGKVAKVEMLGHKGNLRFTQGPQGLAVTMPTEQPGKNAFALKISGLKLG
jgi:alpha-L-fucosidase